MKLVIFIIAAIVIIIIINAIRKFFEGIKLNHALVTYNGRTCSYWEARLWPDEYIHGWVYKYAQFSHRIDIRTGIRNEVTPPQAAAIIDWILEEYPVTSDGATIVNNNESTYDSENRQSTMIWRFSKSPHRGITQKTRDKMISDLLRTFEYIHVAKWPLTEEVFIDDNEENAKKIVKSDLIRKGLC
jgi:hypothetical protein